MLLATYVTLHSDGGDDDDNDKKLALLIVHFVR